PRSRLGALRLVDRNHAAHAARHREVLAAEIPRDAERSEDAALGRLAAGASLLDRVNRARRYARLLGQIVLGPAHGLACGANAIHDGLPVPSRNPRKSIRELIGTTRS